MSTSFKEFMGFKTPVITEADHIFNKILGNIKSELIKHFKLQGDFSNIWKVLDAIEVARPEYSFLKEWFIYEGNEYVKKMDFELPDTDEILDFLDYQSYLLETEDSEQTIRNLVLSITSFYKDTTNFLYSLPIIKLKLGFFNRNVGIGIRIKNSAEDKTSDESFQWKQKDTKSPVDKQAGLLVYA